MCPRLRSLSLLLVAFASAVCLSGCPVHLPDGATALNKVDVEGNDDVTEGEVVASIASDPTHKFLGLVRMWWIDFGVYDQVMLGKDLRRIERYYRARGFYEARVRAGRVIHTGEHEVKVQIIVEEGPKVLVGKVVTHGIEQLPESVQTDVKEAWRVPPGDLFDEKLYRESGGLVERVLTDNGYAYAAVRLAADVDLVTHQATIHIELDPGPLCKFGGVAIVGLQQLPESNLRTLLDIHQGDAYSTRTMRNAQHALFDIGVFDSVQLQPDLSHPGETSVPMVVTVTETKLRKVKAGPGFLLDPLRNDVHVLGSWEDHNFLGGLRTFRYELRPLLMLKPGLTNVKTVRPGFSTGAELRQPSFLEARTTGIVGANTGILPDPINDYRMFSTRGSVGMDRRFGPLLYGGIFYRKGFDYPTPYGSATLPANVFNAQIGYFELITTLDARDDVLRPHQGWYASASLQYAMANHLYFGGDFGDVRFQPEFRFYGPVAKGLTLAFRFMNGFLFARNYALHDPSRRTPTPDDPSSYNNDFTGETPLWRAFFSGGASSNRGYATRSVGLRDCAPGEVGQDCSQVIGGATIWESSLELRFDLVGDLGGVVFLDASDVSRKVFDVRLDYPHLSVGPGIRYMTPFGPIRLDFGWRIPGAQRLGVPLDPRETPQDFNFVVHGPYALHLSIGEAF